MTPETFTGWPSSSVGEKRNGRGACPSSPRALYRGRVDVRVKLFGRGLGALVCELDRALDLVAHAVFYLLQARVVEHALLSQARAEDLYGIALLVLLYLGARAVVAGVEQYQERDPIKVFGA